ncbi:hypothetical protein [Nocardia farcinica]
MNEEESDELLRHIRELVIRNGRGDIDERLISSRLQYDATDGVLDSSGEITSGRREGADRRLFSYLEGLRDELSLGGERAAQETMRRFRNIRTDSGAPIRGITVDMTESDAKAYGTRSIDLIGSPELDAIIADLDAFIAELRESEDNNGP